MHFNNFSSKWLILQNKYLYIPNTTDKFAMQAAATLWSDLVYHLLYSTKYKIYYNVSNVFNIYINQIKTFYILENPEKSVPIDKHYNTS